MEGNVESVFHGMLFHIQGGSCLGPPPLTASITSLVVAFGVEML